MKNKNCVLELDFNRNVIGGSEKALVDAIKNCADLRIYTEFRHNEHIDGSSKNNELIREVSDFPATYLIDKKWTAGIMTLRQPVTLPDRFGERSSMSFFMYNQNGMQAIARPYLDKSGYINPSPDPNYGDIDMTKMHYRDEGDTDENAPCRNFIYDFYSYKFFADDCWTEILSHDENGKVSSGSIEAVDKASREGKELKVAISGICDGLTCEKEIEHELFIATGPHYFYSESGYMVAETRPFVRVKPQIPMVYEHGNWDFGWAIVRSDGLVAGRYYDPYTLKVKHTFSKCKMRWFTKK